MRSCRGAHSATETQALRQERVHGMIHLVINNVVILDETHTSHWLDKM